MQLNKATLKQVRNKVQSKLDELDLAVKFELGHCTYDSDGQYATFKLNVLVEGGKSKEQKDKMLEKGKEIYREYFSMEGFSKNVLRYLQDEK